MKIVFKFLALILLLQSFACHTEAAKEATITSELLSDKKKKILAYINSFECSASVGCNSIAFGSKPCGGPWEYLVFSNAVNLAELQAMAVDYNQAEAAFNLQTGAISDCMAILPPVNVGCVNGKCGVIK